MVIFLNLRLGFILETNCPLFHCRDHGARRRAAIDPLLQFCHCQGAWLQPLQMTDVQKPGWHATNNLGGRNVEGKTDGNRPKSQSPKNISHLGTRQMHPASLDRSQIYHQLSKNRRLKTIHEGFHPDREIPGIMAFRKGPSQMDSSLVET